MWKEMKKASGLSQNVAKILKDSKMQLFNAVFKRNRSSSGKLVELWIKRDFFYRNTFVIVRKNT